MIRRLAICCLALLWSLASPVLGAERLSLSSVNDTEFDKKASTAVTLKAQVLLDRAAFSPGAVDGREGDNYRKALRAFQRAHELHASGRLDKPTWSKLTATSSEPVLTEYEIAQADLKGPFEPDIPRKMEDMAELKRLAYRGPRELLAEKFHMSEALLTKLNGKTSFEEAGSKIVVANVGPRDRFAKIAKLQVDKREKSLKALAQDGSIVAFFPASIGSKEKPAPSGTFEVRKVSENPTYRYNPEFAFKGVKAKHPFTIAPGPNNPVGLVWIDLSARSYGIHGTPDPEKVSKTESHGCIRLTNWDALALAKLVQKGTPVEFLD